MQCEDAQELITGLIDGELAAAEQRALEAHLAECHLCKLQREREAALKQSLKRASAAVAVPPRLRRTISEKIGALAGDRPQRRWPGYRNRLTLPSLRPVAALAAVLVIIAALLSQPYWKSDITGEALAVYRDIASGKALVQVNDPARLKADLSGAVQNRFAPVSPDLSALKLFPVAGFTQKIGGRDVLVTVYRGAGPMVICFTFLGDDSDAPQDAAALFDPETKVNFYFFSRGTVSAVMHRVGEVNCLLVGNLPVAELLAAARGKAHHT